MEASPQQGWRPRKETHGLPCNKLSPAHRDRKGMQVCQKSQNVAWANSMATASSFTHHFPQSSTVTKWTIFLFSPISVRSSKREIIKLVNSREGVAAMQKWGQCHQSLLTCEEIKSLRAQLRSLLSDSSDRAILRTLCYLTPKFKILNTERT